MKISILLPYKENFSPSYPGAVSLYVKDTSLVSKYKKNIIVYGDTKFSKKFPINYINLNVKRQFFTSKTNHYVEKFLIEEKKYPSKLIEVHNRPSYINLLVKEKISAKLILYIHNDPLELRGSKNIIERIELIKNCSKIIFNSKWSKLRFTKNIEKKFVDDKKLIVIYQSSLKNKINFKNKKKNIVFVGKLNRAKGYDLFGKAIIKILDKYPDWNGIVAGDEPREKLIFKHKNLKILGFLPHKKIITLFKKSSISVACSRWNEPLGRTGLEASANGCAVIVSNRGGLPETITDGIILKKIDDNEIFKSIEKLIKNEKIRKKYQINSYKKFKYTHKFISSIIDNYRSNLIHIIDKSETVYSNKTLKVLHVANFNERHDGRLYFVSLAQKISNGLIRLGHSVLNYSDRDIIKIDRNSFNFNSKKIFNKKLIETINNYNPNLLLIGHTDLIDRLTLKKIRNENKNIKISQWFEDPLIKNGPDFSKNKLKILDKINFIDTSFITTSPDILKFINNNKNFFYLPIPVDKSIENLKLFELKNPTNDLFFAMSHGVNRGVLKFGKFDDREYFLNQLIMKNPDIKFDFYGIHKRQPIWGDRYMKVLSQSKMALNLSRGKPIKYYSSNRIASLIGNGLLTFIDKKTKLTDFFSNNEVVFYNNLNDLSKKIKFYKINDKKRKKIAKRGWLKYHSKFNSTIIADYIITKTFKSKSKNKFLWDPN
ncbi:glycosyltransferase [Candidatus Pelagibacter sp.]|nr:glycosyltransferase [Candidatus Pelagibacter sp.]